MGAASTLWKEWHQTRDMNYISHHNAIVCPVVVAAAERRWPLNERRHEHEHAKMMGKMMMLMMMAVVVVEVDEDGADKDYHVRVRMVMMGIWHAVVVVVSVGHAFIITLVFSSENCDEPPRQHISKWKRHAARL